MSSSLTSIVVYGGDRTTKFVNGEPIETLNGLYLESIESHIRMFRTVAQWNNRTWNIQRVLGDDLIHTLASLNPRETLFVVPAGKTTELEAALYQKYGAQISAFIEKGGCFWTTCGGAYAVSLKRTWHGVSKTGVTPLLRAEAIGPLLPAETEGQGFLHEAVPVKIADQDVNIMLDGGGSFVIEDSSAIPNPNLAEQKIEVIAHYALDGTQTKAAALYFKYGAGAGVATMVNWQYGDEDFDPALCHSLYMRNACKDPSFPTRISSERTRMEIVKGLIEKLEHRC